MELFKYIDVKTATVNERNEGATNLILCYPRLFSPQFNTLDGSVDRRSHEGDYPVEEGKPL